MRYRKKPVIIEAITFDELVAHGMAVGGNIINGMPWSFGYKGQPITHENDDCYLIPTLEGTMRFNRGEMLITGVKGEIYPCKPDIFAATYEAVPGEEIVQSHGGISVGERAMVLIGRYTGQRVIVERIVVEGGARNGWFHCLADDGEHLMYAGEEIQQTWQGKKP